MDIEKRDVGWKLWVQWVLVYTFVFVITKEYIYGYIVDLVNGENWLFGFFGLIIHELRLFPLEFF